MKEDTIQIENFDNDASLMDFFTEDGLSYFWIFNFFNSFPLSKNGTLSLPGVMKGRINQAL